LNVPVATVVLVEIPSKTNAVRASHPNRIVVADIWLTAFAKRRIVTATGVRENARATTLYPKHTPQDFQFCASIHPWREDF